MAIIKRLPLAVVFLFAVGNAFIAIDPLFRSYVRQHRAGNAVANSVYACYVGFVIFIYSDLDFFGFNTQFIKTNTFNVSSYTYSTQYYIGFEGNFAFFGLYFGFNTITAGIN